MSPDLDIQKLRAETPGLKNTVHLLACGSALMPECVIDAVVNHIRLEGEIGGYEAHARQHDLLERVYDSVARHIGAKPREIALSENATVAWCNAFYALPLKPGSRILTCEAEYAANYVAFLQRAKRDDLKIEIIPSDASGALDVGVLETMIDADTGLIAITWVPTNGGLVNPAAKVGKLARAHGVPYLLDACQAVGQMPVDVNELGCDFLSATGRKFLRGPRGTGFLYVRESWLETLEPAMIDLYGASTITVDKYTLRDDARRFETWENAYALRAGLGAAVDYAEAIGIGAIEARISALAGYCRDLLLQQPKIQLRDLGDHKCGIVSFSVEGGDPGAIVAALGQAGFVIGASGPSSTPVDALRRDLPNMLRIAPHYYNTKTEIEGCVQRLSDLL